MEVLNGIYEADFVGFSYGFRPGRSAHDALDALAAGIYDRKVNWVLDADIRDFFGSLDHGWLMRFLEHRVDGPAGPAADPEMAQGGSRRERGMVGDGGRDGAGSIGIAAAGQRLPALRL